MMIMMKTVVITMTNRLIFRGLCPNDADHSGLRRECAVARWLGLRVRIPPGERMSASGESCVLLGRSVSEELITRPEESFRV